VNPTLLVYCRQTSMNWHSLADNLQICEYNIGKLSCTFCYSMRWHNVYNNKQICSYLYTSWYQRKLWLFFHFVGSYAQGSIQQNQSAFTYTNIKVNLLFNMLIFISRNSHNKKISSYPCWQILTNQYLIVTASLTNYLTAIFDGFTLSRSKAQ